MKRQFNDVMYLPLLEEYLDSLYNEPSYIIPGFIYKRTIGIMFANKGSFDMITDDFNDETPASISIEHAWHSITRKVDGTVEIIFDSVPEPGDFRVGLMITEDLVKGGSQYNQKSYFNSSNLYPELNGLGDNISGYLHVDVFRDTIFGGIPGRAGVIPQSPELGKSYTVDFSYEVPTEYIDLDVIDDNLKLVAFIGYSDGENLNANEVYVTQITENKPHTPVSKNANRIAVNKISDNSLSFTVNATGKLKVMLFMSNGKLIHVSEIISGNSDRFHTIPFKDTPISGGVYFLNITGERFTVTAPVVLYN